MKRDESLSSSMQSQTRAASDTTSPTPPARLLEIRREGRDEGLPLDLRGARLVRQDLSGLDLAGSDLSGADLSCADLSGANLLAATLTDCTLYEADLTGAELSGADLRKSNLTSAKLTRAGLGQANLEGARLDGADLTHATLSGAKLRSASLHVVVADDLRARDADFRGADCTGARFVRADLHGGWVRNASFDRAELHGCRLSGLRGFRDASWLGIDIREIDFTGAWLCRKFIQDQNFIEEFRRQSRWSEAVYWLWWATSNCGQSILRWSLCTGVIVLVFAWIYTWVGIDFGEYPTILSPLYYSVVTMSTLGYGDVLPMTAGGQVAAMISKS